MSKKFFYNLLILVPVIILVKLLMAIGIAQDYLENLAIDFIYDNNASVLERISTEINNMLVEGYTDEEHQDLFKFMVQVYNRTIGSEDSIISFLVDENMNFSFGSEYYQNYMGSVYIDNTENAEKIKDTIAHGGRGEIELAESNGELNTYFYQNVTDGRTQYYIFIGVDKVQVISDLNVDAVLIPICIIGLLLLFTVEYIIWLKMKTANYEGGEHYGN